MRGNILLNKFLYLRIPHCVRLACNNILSPGKLAAGRLAIIKVSEVHVILARKVQASSNLPEANK